MVDIRGMAEWYMGRVEVVVDTYSRKIVGWALHKRCRAQEWVSAVRTAIEGQCLDRQARKQLVIGSDNGSQPRSRALVQFLRHVGVQRQYTGYAAPDDDAFVERVIRTIKEEEILAQLLRNLDRGTSIYRRLCPILQQ